jgi:hypothetical protein
MPTELDWSGVPKRALTQQARDTIDALFAAGELTVGQRRLELDSEPVDVTVSPAGAVCLGFPDDEEG